MERGNRRQREWGDEKVENKNRQKKEIERYNGRKRDDKKIVKEIEETERDKLGDGEKEKEKHKKRFCKLSANITGDTTSQERTVFKIYLTLLMLSYNFNLILIWIMYSIA